MNELNSTSPWQTISKSGWKKMNLSEFLKYTSTSGVAIDLSPTAVEEKPKKELTEKQLFTNVKKDLKGI
jgi:hypothetical protein